MTLTPAAAADRRELDELTGLPVWRVADIVMHCACGTRIRAQRPEPSAPAIAGLHCPTCGAYCPVPADLSDPDTYDGPTLESPELPPLLPTDRGFSPDPDASGHP